MSDDITFSGVLGRIQSLVDQKQVSEMIEIQTMAVDRLDATNRNLVACSAHAQEKLDTASKLFKKASKQLIESKRDLDFIYKKLTDLRNEIKAEIPRTNESKTKVQNSDTSE